MIELLHIDCLEYMRSIPDKHFELAIVDPPYGLGNRLSDGGGRLKNTPMSVLYRESTQWDVVPDAKYFQELFRVSKNQIICGGNYFLEHLPSSRGVICWDKKQTMPTLSSWEFIWSSFDKPAKTFYGTSTDLNRFHPTQKPVALYKWLLTNYATCKKCNNTGVIYEAVGEKWMGKQAMDCEWCEISETKPFKILDTHLGSGSSAIAAHELGFDFVGCELDNNYFDAAQARFKLVTSQQKMF